MTVVVGIDGNQTTALVRLAAQEAQYRSTPLVVVAGYSTDNALGAPAARPLATMRTPDENRAAAAAMLDHAVTMALGDNAKTATRRTVPGAIGRGVVSVARQEAADLIVFGARRGPALTTPAAQQYVLRHAPCPVLVLPARGTRDLSVTRCSRLDRPAAHSAFRRGHGRPQPDWTNLLAYDRDARRAEWLTRNRRRLDDSLPLPCPPRRGSAARRPAQPGRAAAGAADSSAGSSARRWPRRSGAGSG
jgi:nucleotide-binding universal stress UspA family protein